MTTAQLAATLHVTPRTIERWCVRLGIEKTGRDYILTIDQAVTIGNYCQKGPGRPKC